MITRLRYPLATAALLAAVAASSASAQTITKENNSTSLQFGASYVGGLVPTGVNTLVIDNTLTGTSTTANLGGSVSVLGVNFNAAPVSNAARAFTIGTGGGTLSIGAGGITKAANTSTFLIQSPIALTANQTWTINSVTGTGTGNFAIQGNIADGGFTANITGAGRVDITPSGTVTFGNGVNLNTATVVINNAAAVVNLGNASQADNFQIVKGRAIGSALGNFGVAGSFGDGGTNTAITMGGGTAGDHGFLEYTGATASSTRTFNFDRRTTGSEIRNTNAASTLTLAGNIQNSQGTASANSAYSFGGAGNLALTGNEQLKDNTDAAFSTTLNKNGAGTLTISGANANISTTAGTYQGATNVNAGLLVVSGAGSINSTSGITVADGAGFIYDSSTALTKTVTLASGARFGGDGTVNNISIGNGVKFVFDGNNTGLTVTGTATFDNTFGIDDLANADGSSIVWSLINDGTYTLVSNGGSFSNIENFGVANALLVGIGRHAFFQDGSLQLVVSAIPEPSAYAALAGLGVLGLAAFRRRRA